MRRPGRSRSISKLLRVSAPSTPSSGPDRAFTISSGATRTLLRGTSTPPIVKLRSSNSPAGMSPVIPCICLPNLHANPLRGGRRQYGGLGAGIEEKKDRCAIGENLDDRLVIKHRNRGLGQANGSADADPISGVGGSRRQRCRDDCYASPCLDR